MHEYNETGPTPKTTAITRLVDKARTPAQEFLSAIGTLLTAGDYRLDAYGVQSSKHWNNGQEERESATIILDENTTLTVQMNRIR